MNKNNYLIGRWQGAAMMATTLLGTSIFILPQITVKQAGFSAIYAWLLLTLAIIPITIVFGKLSSKFAHDAGPAYFVEKAFGQVTGNVIGLLFILAVFIGAPAAIVMIVMFAQAILPLSGWELLIAEILILLFLLLINMRGIQVSAKLQFALTLVILMVVITLFSLSLLEVKHFVIEPMNHSAMLSAAGIAFWSFLGVEAMSHLSNDFREPKQDVIPAMLLGTILVGLIYLVCTLLVIWLPNNETISMIGIFDHYLGGYGQYVIGILGIAGGLATVNVYTASLARLVYSFAEQGILPNYLAKKNRFNVPMPALLTLMAIIAIVLVIAFVTQQHLEDLLNWVNGVFVLIYAATMLAAWKLLTVKNRPMILLGVVFCLALSIGIGTHMIYAILLVVIITPIMILRQYNNR